MKEKSQFFNEVDILRRTDHPNIVRLYEFYEDEDSFHLVLEYVTGGLRRTDHPNIVRLYEFYEDEDSFHLVLEYVTGGELFDYIIKTKNLSESIAMNFMKQILSAVAYCHKSHIAHRDLKPENLLLDKEGPDAALKIIDFGTSAIFDPKKQMTHKYGTAYYIAPEVISKNYNEKCDIWSCGVILYILLSGRPPFYGKNDKEILRNVTEGHYSMQGAEWTRISSEAKSLISRMLQFNPNDRITAVQALNHPWIQGPSESSMANVDLVSLSHLQNFHAELKLQYAILSFIAFQMVSKEEAKRLSEVFSKIDKNNDGKLSHDELLEAYMQHMGKEAAIDEVQKIMKQVDVNNSGFIDYNEFITACSAKDELLTKENIDSAFRMIDADNSGKITSSELKEFLSTDSNTNNDVWDAMIKEVDQNGDGEIDVEEFKLMMIDYLKNTTTPIIS
ncbi:hypothetical protein SteCoe_25747 [Stentor coeruleus]|uniref:Calcium-dependent protein kinase 1 n=1 Tax=Stentor coeruleus TaxID=5963 RepID=A0A1R2BEI8_9CILI|nr:hypothetical protein SteCoe_25747 [Stentor coeruleus]